MKIPDKKENRPTARLSDSLNIP